MVATHYLGICVLTDKCEVGDLGSEYAISCWGMVGMKLNNNKLIDVYTGGQMSSYSILANPFAKAKIINIRSKISSELLNNLVKCDDFVQENL
jgi:hypothetical protein